MKRSSRSQMIGLVTLTGVIALGIAGKAYQQSRSSATPPIVLSDPTTKAPLTPPVMETSVSIPPSQTEAKPVSVLSPKAEEGTSAKPAEIVVHVTGAVKKPGVYHLSAEARGEDAIKAAGGTLETANVNALNLAAHVEDGSQIHVPTKKEAPPQALPDPETLVKHDPTLTKTASADHAKSASAKPSKGVASKSGKLTATSKETINLNTATGEQLQRLPGIGPAMAERVLAYRKEAGGFKTVEQIMAVKGIGEKKYAKMERFLRIK